MDVEVWENVLGNLVDSMNKTLQSLVSIEDTLDRGAPLYTAITIGGSIISYVTRL